MPSWLASVSSWLLGGQTVAAPCPERVEPQAFWAPPRLRHVHPDEQGEPFPEAGSSTSTRLSIARCSASTR
jgi:hypothetical protein